MNKAIVAVSFGTTFPATREANIGAVEKALESAFPDRRLYRAFTSPTVVRRIEENEGMRVDFLREALERAAREGMKRIVVQSLHIIPGEEYDKVVEEVERTRESGMFDEVLLGRPLLYTDGTQAQCPDDYAAVVDALRQPFEMLCDNEALVMMGHGSGHIADVAYQKLQDRLLAAKLPIYIGTVEGALTLDDVMQQLQQTADRRVRLMPFMLVAGDHAVNDMAGEEEDSWRSVLEAAGYEVSVSLLGLGEFEMFRKLFVAHAQDAIAGHPCAKLFEGDSQ
jgi:sirohydrochlorin cobaltochelatase